MGSALGRHRNFNVNESDHSTSVPLHTTANGTENQITGANMSPRPPVSTFNDGRRLIDLVLTYECFGDKEFDENDVQDEHWLDNCRAHLYRKAYLKELKAYELDLEDDAFQRNGKTVHLIKIHARFDLLCKLVRSDQLQLPLIKEEKTSENDDGADTPAAKQQLQQERCARLKCCPKELESRWQYSSADERKLQMTHTVTMEPTENLEGISFKNEFLERVHRLRLLWDLVFKEGINVDHLKAVQASEKNSNVKAIDVCLEDHARDKHLSLGWLIEKHVFSEAYVLHDGDLDGSAEEPATSPRKWLRETWANMSRIPYRQPLDAVRNYFGEQIGFYFAFLGFYTSSLFIPAMVGLIVFLYGLAQLPIDPASNEICPPDGKFGNLTVCRNCPEHRCPFTSLGDSCFDASYSSVFDNYGTVIFSFVMSVWAATFLERWKRRAAFLSAHWNIDDVLEVDVSDSLVRIEYLVEAPKHNCVEKNEITGEKTYVVPHSKRLRAKMISIGVIAALVGLVVAVISSTVIYKLAMRGIIYHSGEAEIIRKRSPMIANISGTIFNTICIMIFSRVYQSIARRLTEWEHWKTDFEFEESYTYKMFIFQCVNFYGLLFYYAFFQGGIVGGEVPIKQRKLADHCAPFACYSLVCTQLIILFTVKQFVGNFFEITVPTVKNLFRKMKKNRADTEEMKPAERDYYLNTLDRMPLNGEYFEMIIQFGFVTMFVAAFPLAPLLAFVNNIFEIRLDAHKFVVDFRRPFPSRARNTKVWDTLLTFLSHLAVLTNALLIAFSTQFVDRLYYKLDPVGTHASFFETYMSPFNTSDYADKSLRQFGHHNVTECWFVGMYKRNVTAYGEAEYVHIDGYYVKVMFKLAFVIVFGAIVYLIMRVIDLVVPDVPREVEILSKRKLFKANEALHAKAQEQGKKPSHDEKTEQAHEQSAQ